jgi:hypothetical protein
LIVLLDLWLCLSLTSHFILQVFTTRLCKLPRFVEITARLDPETGRSSGIVRLNHGMTVLRAGRRVRLPRALWCQPDDPACRMGECRREPPMSPSGRRVVLCGGVRPACDPGAPRRRPTHRLWATWIRARPGPARGPDEEARTKAAGCRRRGAACREGEPPAGRSPPAAAARCPPHRGTWTRSRPAGRGCEPLRLPGRATSRCAVPPLDRTGEL